MEYELYHGRLPEKVSSENHGFEVCSIRYDEDGALVGIRYIDVKAQSQSGSIRPSDNEWKKARRYEEQFWLYTITQARTETPQHQRIKNPTG